MFHSWIPLVSAVLVAGCVTATPAERAARAQAEMAQMIEVYGPACEKLGFKREDDKWRDCVLRLAARDDYRTGHRPTTTTCFGHRGFLDCSTF